MTVVKKITAVRQLFARPPPCANI